MIAHLNAEGRDGKVHEAWKGFFDRYEAWTVSLYNLQQIHNISELLRQFILWRIRRYSVLCFWREKGWARNRSALYAQMVS